MEDFKVKSLRNHGAELASTGYGPGLAEDWLSRCMLMVIGPSGQFTEDEASLTSASKGQDAGMETFANAGITSRSPPVSENHSFEPFEFIFIQFSLFP